MSQCRWRVRGRCYWWRQVSHLLIMFYLTYTHCNVINLKSVVNYYPHLVTTSGRYCFCPDRCGFVYLLFCLSSEIIICSGTCHKRSDLFQVKNKMFLDGSSVAPPCFLTLKGQRFRSET